MTNHIYHQDKTDLEHALVQLTLNTREPLNPLEKILELQIQQIKGKGYQVEIPGEWE